ncbi:MAG: BMC domain-containing protein [Ignavibacteriota bacterium]|jgi:microcompartment protein CcmL/EutN|nr:MAG: BMC domain-containing protein [Ignavibacterium sp.]MBL1155366.1 BMC domain-containing protein [Ignavibacteriota bacterium]MCO6449013.1 BMC domain-containing protein [Ignavibacterium album]MCZ2268335.1 BMC domain-containing protein [Ignavibacteriales bacterium]MDX9713086.1 BMC domain-containing protein [Ignavibacteriaceae bacterium]
MKASIGLVELSSIAKGIEVSDAMLKRAEVQMIVNRTICPGKYMVLIGGDVDAVNASVETGVELAQDEIVDHFVIPNVHPSVFPAINGINVIEELDALGVIESFSVASIIECADAAVKAAPVNLITVYLAMAIGGKAYVMLTGDVGSVKAAVDAGVNVIKEKGLLVNKVVIPSPRKEILKQWI